MRYISAALGGVAIIGLSAVPAVAAGSDPAPVPSYPASSAAPTPTIAPTAASNGSGIQVEGKSIAKPAAVKVSAARNTRVAPSQPDGALAFTGSDAITGGLVIGSGLVVVGGGLLLSGRKKRETL